jgi:hypothetical protein
LAEKIYRQPENRERSGEDLKELLLRILPLRILHNFTGYFAAATDDVFAGAKLVQAAL